MKKKPIYMSDLHFEHKVWLSSMAFYKDEIEIFRHRLAEVMNKNNKIEVTSRVESYQNKFIRQREVIDQLVHDINKDEDALIKDVKENPVASDHRFYPDHSTLRNRMESFDHIYKELKSEFMRFIATWM